MKKEDNILVHEYKSKKNLINEIKLSLNRINKEKEFWFDKKEAFKKQIAELIFKIKDFKSHRDQDNVSIEYFKKQRDKHNDEVKSLIKKFKNLNEEKNKILKRYNIRIDPAKIYEKINELERKVEIETEYKKELKLMKQIKELKKVYDEFKEIKILMEKINSLSHEIKTSREKADEFHKKIINSIKDKPYHNFINMTKQITLLKREQENSFNKFLELKNKFFKHNSLLKANIKELEELKALLRKNNLLNHLDREEIIKEILEEKSRQIEEKIKKGRKLTTEDLLAFQAKR